MDTQVMKPLSTRAALDELMEFVSFVNEFRAIERAIWFKGVEGKERDGEHCFQLALVVWFLNQRLELGLDTGRLVFYALVHDLVEVYAGDTPAFAPPFSTYVLRHDDKEEREAASLRRIEREWGARFSDLVRYIKKYDAQEDEESRFVYAADKLVSAMNVFQDGGRSWHKLGETLEHVLAYKLPKVQRHPAIAELFDELVAVLKASPHLFPRPKA